MVVVIYSNQSESSILYHVMRIDQSGAEFGCFLKMATWEPNIKRNPLPALCPNKAKLGKGRKVGVN